MDFRQFLTVIRTRWVLVVAMAVLGALLALGLSLATKPVYSATTQLYVTSSGGDSSGAAYQGSLASQQRVQSYAQLVNSRDVADQVRQRAGVEMSTEDVQRSFSATAAKDTVLLDVTAEDTDPGRAHLLADTLGAVLTDYVRTLETPAGGGEPLAKLTVVGPADTPSSPISPKTTQNIAIGLLAGLLLGTGLAVLLQTLDRRIKNKEVLERVGRVPMIGAIPMNKKRIDAPAVPFREGHSPEAEAYRSLRTNIQFLNVDNPPKAMVVTSSLPGEGKSTTTLNIGLVLAEAGFRVLLIEADMRRPRIARYMGLNDRIGLTNVLSGQADVDDMVQQTEWEGLDLLACGPTPPNPSELLGSKAAEHALERLRATYDFVLIDSPPVLPVTDAAILSRISDGVILIARAQRTTTDQLSRTIDSLQRVDAAILGTVLTLTRPHSRRHGYYYDGYYDSDHEREGGKSRGRRSGSGDKARHAVSGEGEHGAGSDASGSPAGTGVRENSTPNHG